MFGKRLRHLREQYNLSMDRLVELYNDRYDAKMNKSTLSRYENGLQYPIYTVVVNLANFFSTTVDYILGLTEVEGSPKSSEFYRILLSDKGLSIIRKQLAEHIKSYGYEALQEELNLDMRELKAFLTSDLTIGTKCDAQLEKILITLETNLYELFKEAFVNDDIRMYYDLNDFDKAEIRGEMKNMLKANKYTHDAYLAAFGGAIHAPENEKTPDAVRKIFEEERNKED